MDGDIANVKCDVDSPGVITMAPIGNVLFQPRQLCQGIIGLEFWDEPSEIITRKMNTAEIIILAHVSALISTLIRLPPPKNPKPVKSITPRGKYNFH